MNRKFPTVDADGHLEEVHVNWKERLPQRYQAMAPERRPAGNGQSRLFIEGKAWPKPSGPGLGFGGNYVRLPSTGLVAIREHLDRSPDQVRRA